MGAAAIMHTGGQYPIMHTGGQNPIARPDQSMCICAFYFIFLQPIKALACGACNTIEDEAIGCCTPKGVVDAWIKEYQAKFDKAMKQKGGSGEGMMSLEKAKAWIKKTHQQKREAEVCCATLPTP